MNSLNICHYYGSFIEVMGHIAVGRPIGGDKTEVLSLENYDLKTFLKHLLMVQFFSP